MCCESCPKYEDCAARDKLKDACCESCPDYYSCYGEDEEMHDERQTSDE